MLTAQVENLTQRLDEMKPLFPRHYEEISLHQFHGHDLSPIYPIYLQRDARGEALLVTLRQAGALVGYFVGFIAPGLHYSSCLTLTMDIFYVLPEVRGQNGGAILFKEVEREARRRGVKAWFVGSKVQSSLHPDRLFEALGFELSERTYCKWLGHEEN